MARKEDPGDEASHVSERTTTANTQMRIRWDDSKMRSTNPNVFYVSGGREEITLLFGRNQPWDAGQNKVTVQLSNRILLSHLVAKRLVSMLNNTIQDYESKYGSLDMESPPPIGLDQTPSVRQPFSETGRAAEKAGLIFHLMKNLNVEIGFERSFKIFEKNLLGNRFLLGISKNSIEQKPHERILDICERMDMPESLLETFRENLSDANYVHFGFEENERSCVYKAYLEFYDKIEKEIKNRPNKSGPFLLHLGFKWDALDNTKRALARYTWYPLLSAEDILIRLSNILDSHQYGKPLEIAKGIVGIASRRIPHYDILYLEVTEDNNPRRSFDINMYRAKLQLKELNPLLLKMWQHYSIPSDEFHKLYDRFKTKTFGHLSGGIDRAGRDFLTVYYGVEGSST